MDVSAIYSLERLLTTTDSSQMPDSTLKIFTNLAYHELENIITTRINEDFFYDEWTWNIIANQREYEIPPEDLWDNDWGCKKILWVSIKYKNSDINFTKLDETRITNLNVDKWYLSQLDIPEYYIADNHFFLLQNPTESIDWWAKIYWIANLLDLDTWWSESTIKLPKEFHELIASWASSYIFQALSLFDKANAARAIYLRRIEDMVSQLSDRNSWPNTIKLPNLNFLA